MTVNEILSEKIAALPTRCGVYRFMDKRGAYLYIGKAKNLRSRVRSYFRGGDAREGRIRLLIRKTADVDVIVTDTESEALILENNLIKKLRPRYNINLRDDKTYPYICIKNEPFPRIFPTRTLRKDGSRYFGPYADVGSMRRALEAIRSVFKIRTCALNLAAEHIQAGKYQPCLEYHIEKCAAPCVGYQSSASYDETIAQIVRLLNGHSEALIQTLQEAMQGAATATQFEEAAALRNRISAIRKYSERQKVVATDQADRDLFALATSRQDNVAAAVLFKVREGKMIGRWQKVLRRIEGTTDGELLQSAVEAYYTEASFFPDEVYLSTRLADESPLADFLRSRRGRKVAIRVPQRGEKAALMRMIEANARLLVGEWKVKQMKRGEERIPYALKSLRSDLDLERLPRRIECMDVSHLGGTGTVASCVVFEMGKPRKRDYRAYRIRSAEGGPDDFQAMREAVYRRYARVRAEGGPWPDLLVIDGGKGQVSSAVTALKGAEAYSKFPVIGLAKRLEEVYVPGDRDPVFIARHSASLQLIQQVRDEAHRFALEFQRKRRKKRLLHSELLAIRGVGPKTAQKLVRAFGSVRKVKEAGQSDLAAVVGPWTAERIRAFVDHQSEGPKSLTQP